MNEADSERMAAEGDLQSLKQKYAKASGDLQDLRLQSDDVRARNAELERKQKRYELLIGYKVHVQTTEYDSRW